MVLELNSEVSYNMFIAHNDYCNCLLAGAPQYQLNRLQAVMNLSLIHI